MPAGDRWEFYSFDSPRRIGTVFIIGREDLFDIRSPLKKVTFVRLRASLDIFGQTLRYPFGLIPLGLLPLLLLIPLEIALNHLLILNVFAF